ncbi:MAG: MucR family transcriptional regulator [Albidovulum sp.]
MSARNHAKRATPADYRARWQLSKEYPLVASAYSKYRARTAKKIGLGRKPKAE